MARPPTRGTGFPTTARSAFGARAGGSLAGTSRSISPCETPTMPMGILSVREPRVDMALPLANLCCSHRRGDNVLIGAAPAEMAADCGLHVLRRRIRITLNQGGATHHQARRTKTALHGIVFNEGGLHRMKSVAVGQALDCYNRPFANVDRQDHAGRHRSAVEPDGAGRAGATVARDFGTGETERPAQDFG